MKIFELFVLRLSDFVGMKTQIADFACLLLKCFVKKECFTIYHRSLDAHMLLHTTT